MTRWQRLILIIILGWCISRTITAAKILADNIEARNKKKEEKKEEKKEKQDEKDDELYVPEENWVKRYDKANRKLSSSEQEELWVRMHYK